VAAGDNDVKNERTYSVFWIAGKNSTNIEVFRITASGFF